MTPPFSSLKLAAPSTTHRWVGTTQMDEEQYQAEGWELVKGFYWRANLEGLRGYGRLTAQRRQERINAAVTRRESDDQWSSHVTSLLDMEP